MRLRQSYLAIQDAKSKEFVDFAYATVIHTTQPVFACLYELKNKNEVIEDIEMWGLEETHRIVKVSFSYIVEEL